MESGEQAQQQQPQYQPPKLAPWAKMSETTTSNGAESSLSLAEIQKLEEEREREAKMRRDIAEAAQARARQQEEEARRQQVCEIITTASHKRQLHRDATFQNIGLNWATAVNSMEGSGGQKSLAEIQAEEARQERERQERERREKKARQKNLSLAQASVWGSASTNLSWASKTAAASSAPYSAPIQQPPPAAAATAPPPQPQPTNNFGFWDSNDVAPVSQPKSSPQPQQSSAKKNKGKNNKLKEENKVASIFKESKGKPENEFEEWCINALEKLDPQVDIPTFLGFLNDVESPYEVCYYSIISQSKRLIFGRGLE